MKKITTFLLCVLLLTPWLSAQKNTYLKESRARIDFRETQNNPAKMIPELLLRAFCSGEIDAYFPGNTDIKMTYQDFLTHFGMSNATVSNTSDFLPCPGQTCMSMDPWTLQCFSVYMDIKQVIQTDQTHSDQDTKVKALRLVYSAECNPANLDYYGPVFKVNDIRTLSDRYRVPNPQNSAETKSIYAFLTLRLFSATTFEVNGEMVTNPAKEEQKQQKQRIDMEGGMWEN